MPKTARPVGPRISVQFRPRASAESVLVHVALDAVGPVGADDRGGLLLGTGFFARCVGEVLGLVVELAIGVVHHRVHRTVVRVEALLTLLLQLFAILIGEAVDLVRGRDVRVALLMSSLSEAS